MKKDSLKQDISPPLTEKALSEISLNIPCHRVDRPPSSTACFDVIGAAGDHSPKTTTHLVRRQRDGKNVWQVELTVEGAGIRRSEPPVLETVRVDRKDLARRRIDLLAPSVPDGDRRIATRPKPRRLPDPYQIRFGDLRYRPTTIFDPDGRRAYYDETYPWRCLVRVTTPTGRGSGVLIGPRHVLTASHCVDWTPGWLRVDVLYANGSGLASAGGLLAYAESHVGPGSIPDDESDEDYAVIVLDQRLGDIYGWLGSRTYNSSWDDETSAWHSIGYPGDLNLGETPVWQTGFFLNELGADFGSARLIRSDSFDNWPGQSGSPVFGFWPEGPLVVGVVSGEGSDFNYISGGSLLPTLIGQARGDHP
ncbi:MAG: hypothetical protein QOJ94_3259 [Sphingomonadales bacterium]|jgi:hypothetical protein|nr:hypothetical protein [Sphingomonadales bacterium]